MAFTQPHTATVHNQEDQRAIYTILFRLAHFGGAFNAVPCPHCAVKAHRFLCSLICALFHISFRSFGHCPTLSLNWPCSESVNCYIHQTCFAFLRFFIVFHFMEHISFHPYKCSGFIFGPKGSGKCGKYVS